MKFILNFLYIFNFLSIKSLMRMEKWRMFVREKKKKCIRVKYSINFFRPLRWECYIEIMLYMINYIIHASHCMIYVL